MNTERRVNLLSLPQLRLTLLQLKLLLLRTLLQLYLLLPACRATSPPAALCRWHRPPYDGRAHPPTTANGRAFVHLSVGGGRPDLPQVVLMLLHLLHPLLHLVQPATARRATGSV